MSDNIFDILKAAVLTEAQLNADSCNRLFENGAENIYLVDEAGRYKWRSLWKKDFESRISTNKNAFIYGNLEPVMFNLSITEENSEALLECVEKAFSHNNANVTEVPILKNDGTIVAVARKRQKDNISLYEKNKKLLSDYEFFDHDIETEEPTTALESNPVQSKIKEFLAQIESEKPILLVDEYDVEELEWMCTKLRSSEKYGSDNKLYLQYSSWDEFRGMMCSLDWKECVATRKIVFLFGAEGEKYDIISVDENRCAPQKLSVDEIDEIIYTNINGFQQTGASGVDFFNMILDGHPSLLTVGHHSVPTFGAIYLHFCNNIEAGEAINRMISPSNDDEESLLKGALEGLTNFDYDKRKDEIIALLYSYLELDKVYGIKEWFSAIYLATNEYWGRSFTQRISPAIFYDLHSTGTSNFGIELGLMKQDVLDIQESMVSMYKYRKGISVVRNPVSRFGSITNIGIMYGKNSWWKSAVFGIEWFVRKVQTVYTQENDKDRSNKRMVRFEDLKLFPRETLLKVCEYLRIPWSDTLLTLTQNGEDGGMVDGTVGWDTRPVYKEHKEHMSNLDYYRIELLKQQDIQNWGYKLKYYDGVEYSDEDLKRLFDIPFKIETMELEMFPEWPDDKKIKELHEWLYQIALERKKHGEIKLVDGYGNKMIPVECLVPDIPRDRQLF